MMTSCRSAFALVLPVAFAVSGLSLVACGGEVAPSAPESTNPEPANPPPGTPQPGAPQGSALVGTFGHESPPPMSYDTATVVATATAATFEFQCMRGDTSAVTVDASGAFTAHGTLSTTGGFLQSFPDATFTGTVEGNTLTLTATWQTTITSSTGTMPYTETYGPVTFTKGVVPTHQIGCI
jgi:hypothetical protein